MSMNQGALAPIHDAVWKNDLQYLKMLIAHGTDVSMRTSQGATPLLLAAEKGSVSLAQELLFNKADPYAVDRWGQTALHIAAFHGNVQLVQALLLHMDDISATTKRGNRAVDMCQDVHTHRLLVAHLNHQATCQRWRLEDSIVAMSQDLKPKQEELVRVSKQAEVISCSL
ncbi:hypothetical protein ABBQ38_008231 [Trebouxia sp. C0009 RCD-2024]